MRKITTLFAAAALVGVGLVVAADGAVGVPTSQTFAPGTYTFTVPAGVTSLDADASGAQGGSGAVFTTSQGGLGGRVTASIAVTPGETLTFIVGARGTDTVSGNGGGATFVRRGTASLLVAGGGGGGGEGNAGDPPGNGGNGGASGVAGAGTTGFASSTVCTGGGGGQAGADGGAGGVAVLGGGSPGSPGATIFPGTGGAGGGGISFAGGRGGQGAVGGGGGGGAGDDAQDCFGGGGGGGSSLGGASIAGVRAGDGVLVISFESPAAEPLVAPARFTG